MFLLLPPACISLAWEELCPFVLTLRRLKPARWRHVAMLVMGLNTLSWGQCFQATPHAVGYRPGAIAVGDFNEDGHSDLITANTSNASVSVLMNNGQGGFGVATSVKTGYFPFSIAVDDFNSDNHQDLAVADLADKTIWVIPGNGQGSFGTPTKFAVYVAERDGPRSVVAGDFNRDGKPDLAASNNGISVLLNNGKGGFNAPTYLAAGGYQIAAADVNKDSYLDLITVRPGSISIVLGDGNGGFSAPTNVSVNEGAYSLAVADLNGDDKLDIVTANNYYGNISVLLGDGTGRFNVPTDYPAPQGGKGFRGVSVGDVNGDNQPDVVVANWDANTVSVLLGNKTGSFGTPTNFAVGTNPLATVITDFDKDNKMDLAVANYEANTVSILYNCGLVSPPALPAVTGFELINADNGQVIRPLIADDTVNLALFPTTNLNIRAITNPATEARVELALSGLQNHSQTEQTAPYALFGKTQTGAYNSWTPQLGQYSLLATPYTDVNDNGTAGQSLGINFTVIDQATLAGLLLINADNGHIIDALTDGQVLNLSTLPTRNLSIRANANQGAESVTFALTGAQQHTKTESYSPFALFGDFGFNKYVSWTPPLGNYSLTVTPHRERFAGGSAGPPITINFTVVDQAAARMAAFSAERQESPLTVSVLSNPTSSEQVEIDISGAVGQSLDVVLSDAQGRVVSQQHVEQATASERQRMPLGQPAGLYLLRVATSTASTTTRVLRLK